MKATLSLLLMAALVAGCRTATSPETSSSISGRIILFDSSGTVQSDFSGVRVSIDGKSVSTATDASGYWQFADLRSGTYDITATKAGYGTWHYYQQTVVNGHLDEMTAALAQVPSVAVQIDSVAWQGNILCAFLHSPTVPPCFYVYGFVDLDSAVTSNSPHLVNSNYTGYEGGCIQFKRDDLLAAGMRPGSIVYVSASLVFARNDGFGGNFLSWYQDQKHDGIQFASAGSKSNVVAITLP